MASPNSTFTELASTTLRNHKKEIKDNLSNRNALLKYLTKKGNYVKLDGGLSIAAPLDYQANGTYQRYSDYDVLNIQQSEVLTTTEYQWRQIAINVVASGRELRINSGQKIVDFTAGKLKNALRTFNNNFSVDLYSSGSITNQINGIQALVADTPTNTVGGIDSNVWGFWKNKVFDCSDNSVTPGSTTIENQMMLPLWLQLDRGPSDCPDLIIADNLYYSYFEASQTSLKFYSSAENASAGFVSLKYKNADVVYDGNSGIPAAHLYMLNTEYLKLHVHKDADLQELPDKNPVNGDSVVMPIIWMGNLVCTNRAQQGVIIA